MLVRKKAEDPSNMVLGLRSKSKKGITVSFNVCLHEIRPWPQPRTGRSPPLLMVQWQRGDKRTGSTKSAAPLIGETPDKDKIIFNDSFRLPATLYREESKSGKVTFQKKCVVFSLVEVQSDRTIKGQPLGRAVLDLADFASIDTLTAASISIAVAKKEHGAVGTPNLYLSISPYGKKNVTAQLDNVKPYLHSSPSSRDPKNNRRNRRPSDANSQESVTAASVSDEEDEDEDEEEIASFTDDEASPPSPASVEPQALLPEAETEKHVEVVEMKVERVQQHVEVVEIKTERVQQTIGLLANSSPVKSAVPAASTVSDASKRNVKASPASVDYSSEPTSPNKSFQPEKKDTGKDSRGKIASIIDGLNKQGKTDMPAPGASHEAGNASSPLAGKVSSHDASASKNSVVVPLERMETTAAHEKKFSAEEDKTTRAKTASVISNGSKTSQKTESPPNEDAGINVLQLARTKFAKSAEDRNDRLEKKALEDARAKAIYAEAKATAAEQTTKELELHLERIDGELRDTAAIELALYSVVAQHSSSFQKVHSPARRLARLYIHSCKNFSQERRASTARNCVSGFLLASRACGNDIPRLTFWWSNVVVFREMVSQAFDLSTSAPEQLSKTAEFANGNNVIVAAGNGKPGSESNGNKVANSKRFSSDWREPSTLAYLLERIEAWIFRRIIESIWWQALAPQMQRSAELSNPSSPNDERAESVTSRLRRSLRGLLVSDFSDARQGSISVELWKTAIVDALHKLCPLRAGGHECGCLRSFVNMVLKQLVGRLDVAMFNAILRNYSDDVPTDPISDPITELNVLPIPAGRLSFGSGAQLKNVVGTWSNWLTTLGGEDGSSGDNSVEKGSDYFTLLKAMSDLLMLPKDMLMDKSVRKEVCPALSLPLIKRILSQFVTDEFYPDPVPPSLLAAISAEISMEKRRQGEAEAPNGIAMASAPLIVYTPPHSNTVRELIGENSGRITLSRSNSSMVNKGHNSDDELQEVESPLCLLADDCTPTSIAPNKQRTYGSSDAEFKDILKGLEKDATGSARRFKLLREVWC